MASQLAVRFDDDPDLLRRFRVLCVERDCSMAEVVRSLVKGWCDTGSARATAPHGSASAAVRSAPVVEDVKERVACPHPSDAFDAGTGRCGQCGEDVG